MRPYVGQASIPPVRIPCHIRMMKTGEMCTLHYYMFNVARQFRRWNFVRLWTITNLPEGTIDDSTSEKRYTLLSNILEMTFCRVFQSLPATILEVFFGPLPNGEFSNLGLNVLPPLYQGDPQTSSLALRSYFRNLWKASPDIEIQSWPRVRKAQINRQHLPNCDMHDHKQAIEDLLKTSGPKELHFDGTTHPDSSGPFDLDNEFITLTNQVGSHQALIPPVGSINARLGVMYDQCTLSGSKRARKTNMPWGMENAGLGSINSLVWTPSLGTTIFDNTTGIQDTSSDSVAENHVIQFNRRFLAASGLRVVLVCGKRMEDALQKLLPANLSPAHVLRLRTYEARVYLQMSEVNIIRIFLASPSPWSNNTSSRLIQAKELRELLKFSATITKTEGIRYIFYESSSVMVRFIDEYLSEKQCGISRITSASLPSSYRKFLHASGFTTDESIRELERAAGTILTGMVMLINLVRRNTVLPSPQNPPEMGNCRHQGEEQQSPPTKQYIGNTILIKQPFTDTKALYERMNQRNLDDAHAITQHCVMTQFLLLGTLKPTQFSTLKKASYRVEKHDSGRRFRFRWTTFKAPDDFDIELLDPRRV